jgi:hypothetical protein
VCAVWVWGIASWVEIVCKNTEPNPHYSEYNLLVSVIESREVRWTSRFFLFAASGGIPIPTTQAADHRPL